MFTTIIDAQALAKKLNDSDSLVLDCRFSLADAHYGERVYAEGHIAGAQYLNLDDDLSSPITPESGRHPLPNIEKLTAKLNSLGMTGNTQVVVYDDCANAMAGRAWWVLRWMGHKAVAVLDGGLPKWIEEGRELQTETPKVGDKGNFKPEVQNEFTVEIEELVKPNDWQLVDARSVERFRGEEEPIDPIAGRIPGALNRPLTDNLNNGVFKSAEELREEWETILKGIDPETVVHMCGSGVTACHNQIATEIAGIHGTRLYPGSWSEWIRDSKRPVGKG